MNHSGISSQRRSSMVNFDRGMQIPAQVSQPDLSPENMTVSDYSGEFEAKIAQLEQQIAQVKERIARNERTLNNKSFEDVNNKLADLEMSKIGFRLNKPSVNQDPTSFWRWNMQRLDTQKANDQILIMQNKFNSFAMFVIRLLKVRHLVTMYLVLKKWKRKFKLKLIRLMVTLKQ